MVDTAIFLGAGASKAEGAPLQGELFKECFSSDIFKNSYDSMDRELATFFSEMFQIDVDGDISNIRFPTFEEVLMPGESTRPAKSSSPSDCKLF